MRNLTLQQVFGVNASQTATALIIQKADLPNLTVAANNQAEQLIVALLLQLHQQFEGVLTDEQDRAITDEQGKLVTYNNQNLYQKLGCYHWKKHFSKGIQLDIFVIDIFADPFLAFNLPISPNAL